MPLSPSKTRRNLIFSPNNRKVTDFFKVETSGSPAKVNNTVELPPASDQNVSQTIPDSARTAPSNPAFNCSFTSVSSTTSSSRRIVTGGLHAVTNSDSDSLEDASDSSADELVDADSFIRRGNFMITPPDDKDLMDFQKSVNGQRPRQSSRLSLRSTQRGKRQYDEFLTPPRRKYKYGLAEMVKQQAKIARDDAKIAAIEAETEGGHEFGSGNEGLDSSDTRTVAVAVAGDNEDGDRMHQALERTEALEREERFFFLSSPKLHNTDHSFPGQLLGDGSWAAMMGRDTQRAQACLSGFASEMAAIGHVPEELTLWFGLQIRAEKDQSLCDAYVSIIEACHENARPVHQSLSSLQTFYSLDCRVTHHSFNNNNNDPHSADLLNLPYVLRVLQACAATVSLDILCRTISDLTLLNIDANICSNAHLHAAIQDCIESLVEAIPVDTLESVSLLLHKNLLQEEVLSTTLRYKAVSTFPATTAKSHDTRRYLALFCITRDSETRPLSSPNWPKLISRRLAKLSESILHDKTDFVELAAFAEALDVAVGMGFSPMDYPWCRKECGEQADWLNRAPRPCSEETAFNSQIDMLISSVKAVKSRIKEAGATHLRRFEARSALERVELRLEHSVRSRPRPPKDIFGADTEKHQRKLMELFTNGDRAPGEKETLPNESCS